VDSWQAHDSSLEAKFQAFGSDILFDLFGSGSIFLTENFAGDACRNVPAPIIQCDRNGDGVVDDHDLAISAVVAKQRGAGCAPPRPLRWNRFFGFSIQDDWRIRSESQLKISACDGSSIRTIFGTDNGLHKPCPTPLSTASTSPCIWLQDRNWGLTETFTGLERTGVPTRLAWDRIQDR